uniref:Cytochrome P450 n=1 Tax=Ditylum brightwellii TaxID=49249 RepID=A0A7S1Z5M4_9STRA
MKEKGYDGVVPVDLSIFGKYNFLLSPESVRAATVEESSILPRRFSVPLFETLELDRGIVYEQGERHKRNKRMCIPSFEQSQSMESFVGATKAELDDLSLSFQAKANDDDSNIDLYAEMRKSALNVVLDVSFGLGKEGASNFQRADELSKTIAEYLERIVALANEIPPLWQISPRLSYNYVRVTDVVLPNLRKLVSEVIEARRLEGEEGKKKRNRADLLGVLVEQLDDNADVRLILFDVVIAGSDTTASTSTAALYLLHQDGNKEWLERARREAEETNAGRDIPLEKIRSTMPVCVSIAREVLRLYPPVPFVGRTATGSGSLLDGKYPVEPGDTFCFSPWFLGRDPTQWANAADFYPQRWLDDPTNGGAPNNFSWLPFGAGLRGCLGTRLGLTEVTLGIARLLVDFEFDFETKGPLPVKYDLTLNLDGVMNCKITSRTPRGTNI